MCAEPGVGPGADHGGDTPGGGLVDVAQPKHGVEAISGRLQGEPAHAALAAPKDARDGFQAGVRRARGDREYVNYALRGIGVGHGWVSFGEVVEDRRRAIKNPAPWKERGS